MSRQRTTWREDEKQYLIEQWGEKTPDAIAKYLGRTTTAVVVYSKTLKLGPYLENSEYLGMHQVTELLGVDSHVPERTWIPKYNMPFTKRRIRGNLRFKVIRLDQLMKWLKDNQDAWDSRKVELYALGTEPEWLKQKRAADAKKPTKPIGTKYTAKEDAAIVWGLKHNKTYGEIGQEIGRSYASVQARAGRLDIWGTGKLKEKWK